MYHDVINFGYKMMSLFIVRLTFSAIAQGQFTCCLKINIFSLRTLTKQQLNIVSSILGVLFVIPLNQPYSNWYNSLEGFFMSMMEYFVDIWIQIWTQISYFLWILWSVQPNTHYTHTLKCQILSNSPWLPHSFFCRWRSRFSGGSRLGRQRSLLRNKGQSRHSIPRSQAAYDLAVNCLTPIRWLARSWFKEATCCLPIRLQFMARMKKKT